MVRDRRALQPDALRDLSLGLSQAIHHLTVAERLLDRIQVPSLEILDEGLSPDLRVPRTFEIDQEESDPVLDRGLALILGEEAIETEDAEEAA